VVLPLNVHGSMPGLLGGVSQKVYKEVVKTPKAFRIFVFLGNTERREA
jgi:hypothetical protein